MRGDVIKGVPCVKRYHQLFCPTAGNSYPMWVWFLFFSSFFYVIIVCLCKWQKFKFIKMYKFSPPQKCPNSIVVVSLIKIQKCNTSRDNEHVVLFGGEFIQKVFSDSFHILFCCYLVYRRIPLYRTKIWRSRPYEHTWQGWHRSISQQTKMKTKISFQLWHERKKISFVSSN